MPRLNTICQRPGSIHRLSGAKRKSDDGEQHAGHARGNELLGRRMDHLVGEPGVDAPRASHHLDADQDRRMRRRSRPTT